MLIVDYILEGKYSTTQVLGHGSPNPILISFLSVPLDISWGCVNDGILQANQLTVAAWHSELETILRLPPFSWGETQDLISNVCSDCEGGHVGTYLLHL